MDDVAYNLGNNIRQLRETRGLTQAQIAKIAAVPRPTWANLESGAANPTLAVMIKVADALQVSLEELISPPRTTSTFFKAADLPVRKRGKVRVRRLIPESIAGLEIERIELPAGSSMTGIPHTPGTREYCTCESGEVQVSESGQIWCLEPGDVLAFRGDQAHGYRNRGRVPAVAYSVIALAPLAG